jgi:enamine deaminase RidA (YjgF/YER057c/UK114 family)
MFNTKDTYPNQSLDNDLCQAVRAGNTVYVRGQIGTDFERYREPVYQEVGKWLKGVFPISTGLCISALGQPQWLMEIDVIAVIPEGWQPGAQ